MSEVLRHRGPDSGDFWIDREAGVGLAHRRLSIIDLSPAGAQPMVSADGRYVISFNGEIYNHLSMRVELAARDEAPKWRGHSDTETLLAAIAAWGIETTLRRACGMFALALWNRRDEVLVLARDRMGEKPLYLARCERGWAFGSELRALHAAPGFRPWLDRDAVSAFLTFGYVPEGRCIYQGVSKVPPGTFTQISRDSQVPSVHFYHAFDQIVEDGLHARSLGHDREKVARDIEATLSTVIDEQMLSDVPLGCFLSGGVDSTLVASLMQAQSTNRIKTFSIGFNVAHLNEVPYAAEVARHLGTDHSEFILSEDDALAVVPELASIYDEPFADSSQIPTALLCRAARKSVTVALTGDGGDEVFGGYNRHVLGPDLLRYAQRIPRWLRRTGARAARGLEHLVVTNDAALRRLTSALGFPVTTIDKLTRLAPALADSRGIEELYRHFVCTFENPAEILSTVDEFEGHMLPGFSGLSRLEPAEWMMLMDSTGYLPGDILTKVDRAAMSVSLETRAPFLDMRVLEAAWRLPLEARIRGRVGKAVLRDILERHVPPSLMERPKQGFAVPLDHWLRNPLQGWADALLGREDLVALAGLDRDALATLWQEHLSGRANRGPKLWTVLMLLAWLENRAEELRSSAAVECAA